MLFSSLFEGLTRATKLNRESRPNRRASPGRKGSFRPTLETLEDRNLLSAGMLNHQHSAGGKTFVNVGTLNNQGLPSVAVARDGSTVLVAEVFHPISTTPYFQDDIVVTELNKDGSTNSKFGTGGQTILSNVAFGGFGVFGVGFNGGCNVAVQSDGTIVLEGAVHDATLTKDSVFVAELNEAGHLKSDFGNGGEATFPLPVTLQAPTTDFIARPNGKIVIYASVFTNDSGTTSTITVAQLTRDGKLDFQFGTDGEVVLAGNLFGASTDWVPYSPSGESTSTFNPLALLPNGTIVLTGTCTDVASGFPVAIGVLELRKDGSMNPIFGMGGEALVTFDSGPNTFTIILNSVVNDDGNILLAVATSKGGGTSFGIGLAELNDQGHLNTHFGAAGEAFFDSTLYPWFIQNMAVEPNGVIVLGGATSNATTGASEFFVAELTKEGTLNPNFGGGGIKIGTFGANYSSYFPALVAVQPDGSIALALTVTNMTTGSPDFAVAELTKDGTLDPSFGSGGEIVIDFGVGLLPFSLSPANVVVQPDGTVVLAGMGATANSFSQSSYWAVIGIRHHNDGDWADERD